MRIEPTSALIAALALALLLAVPTCHADQGSADVEFEVLPGGWVSINLNVSIKPHEPLSFEGTMCVAVSPWVAGSRMYVSYDISHLPSVQQVYLPTVTLTVHYDEPRGEGNFNIEVQDPHTNIEWVRGSFDFEVLGGNESSFHLEAVAKLREGSIPPDILKNLESSFAFMKGMIISEIEESSGHKFKVEQLDLHVDPDRLTVTLTVDLRGDIAGGLESMYESYFGGMNGESDEEMFKAFSYFNQWFEQDLQLKTLQMHLELKSNSVEFTMVATIRGLNEALNGLKASLLGVTEATGDLGEVLEALDKLKLDFNGFYAEVTLGERVELMVRGLKVIYEEDPDNTLSFLLDLLKRVRDVADLLNVSQYGIPAGESSSIMRSMGELEDVEVYVSGGSTSRHEAHLILPEGSQPFEKVGENRYRVLELTPEALSKISVEVEKNEFGVAEYKVASVKVSARGDQFDVLIASNSTVKDVVWDEDEQALRISVEGLPGTLGAINATIPRDMFPNASERDLKVFMDGKPARNYEVSVRGGVIVVFVSYYHSSHVIEVKVPEAVSELNLLWAAVVIVVVCAAVALSFSLKRWRHEAKHFA